MTISISSPREASYNAIRTFSADIAKSDLAGGDRSISTETTPTSSSTTLAGPGTSVWRRVQSNYLLPFFVQSLWGQIFDQVGSCGGWILAKSLELCVTSDHQTPWQFYNQGQLETDESFQIMEMCKFHNDFRPLPKVIKEFDIAFGFGINSRNLFPFTAYHATISFPIHASSNAVPPNPSSSNDEQPAILWQHFDLKQQDGILLPRSFCHRG